MLVGANKQPIAAVNHHDFLTYDISWGVDEKFCGFSAIRGGLVTAECFVGVDAAFFTGARLPDSAICERQGN